MFIKEGVLTEIYNTRTDIGEVPVVPNNPFECEGPFAIEKDGYITAELSCTVLTPNPSLHISIEPFLVEGRFNKRQNSLNLVSIEGNTQRTRVSVNGTLIQERERKCIQSINAFSY